MKRLTRTQPWMPAMLVLLAVGLIGLGWWAGKQVESGVITRKAGEAALNLSRLLSPPLPELAQGAALTPDHIATLQRLVGPTPLGQTIVAFKVWDPQGRILHSSLPALIGQTFPVKDELARALRGEVVFAVSDLADTENTLERGQWDRLLEVYSPVQNPSTGQVTAVVELYQTVDALEQEARQAQTSNWLLFGGVIGITYLLLAGTLRRDRDAVLRQQREWQAQVAQLAERLEQAQASDARTRHGAAGVTAAYEQALRQVAAEWRAGPAQNLSYALLQLDQALTAAPAPPDARTTNAAASLPLVHIERALRSAFDEMQLIADKYALPALDALTLPEVAQRAIAAHRQRAGGQVDGDLGDLPEQAPGAVKIALYRFVRAGLTYARHQAGGDRQRVTLRSEDGFVRVAISNCGWSRPEGAAVPADSHPALTEARHQVESVGGVFAQASDLAAGLRLTADLPLPVTEGAGW